MTVIYFVLTSLLSAVISTAAMFVYDVTLAGSIAIFYSIAISSLMLVIGVRFTTRADFTERGTPRF